MSSTYTFSTSFTITHARYLASKVAADMRQMNLHYGAPNLVQIPDYEEELAILLKGGYVWAYEFGFKRDEKRVVTCYYTRRELASADDRPGKVDPSADITGQ